MDIDGPLLERIGLLFDGQFVGFSFRWIQSFRTLRRHQSVTEMRVYLRQIKGRSCSDLSKFIIHKPAEFLRSLLHQIALPVQINFKGFYQPDGHKSVIFRLGKHQSGLRGKITGPWSSGASRCGIDRNDLSEFLQIGLPIVLRL